jgi:hypothetical protein
MPRLGKQTTNRERERERERELIKRNRKEIGRTGCLE